MRLLEAQRRRLLRAVAGVPGVRHLARARKRLRSQTAAAIMRMEALIDSARAAAAGGNRAEALATLTTLTPRRQRHLPAASVARLVHAYIELGERDRAAAALATALQRLGQQPALTVARARLAMAEGVWPEAVRLYEALLAEAQAPATDKMYAHLGIAYRELGHVALAEAVLSRGRSKFPESQQLAVEWAQLAMVREDWPEAAWRYEAILERFGAESSDKVYARLAIAYREQGNCALAAGLLERGRERFPDSPLPAIEWAQLAMVEADWAEGARRYETVLDQFPEAIFPKIYRRLGVAYRQLGDTAAAGSAVRRGVRRFPSDVGLLTEWAEVAMVAKDWRSALHRWQAVLTARMQAADRVPAELSFPVRGMAWDWSEHAWHCLVSVWEDLSDGGPDRKPPPELYQAVATTSIKAGLISDAATLLAAGTRAYPTHSGLAFQLTAKTLAHGVTGFSASQHISEPLAGPPAVRMVRRALADAATEGNQATLDSFRTPPMGPADELGALHVVRVPKGSSLELLALSGRYLSKEVIAERVRALSQRDAWPEMTSSENLVLAHAMDVAEEYGKRFEDLPYLPAEVLAEAVLFIVQNELCLFEPMRRLAADIAAERDPAPVFVGVSGETFRYLDGYTFSQFDTVYLYYELRRNGVNAFLCFTEQSKVEDGSSWVGADAPATPTKLHFRPGARSVQPRGVVRRLSNEPHTRALVPSGVRSVPRVLDVLGPTLVYASGSAIKEFAYDRSIAQGFPFEPRASIHPPAATLPTISVDLWPAARLSGVQLVDEGLAQGAGDQRDLTVRARRPVTGRVEVSAPVGGGWLDWLHRVLHGYLQEMAVRAQAEVAARGIEEAHVCDHLFAEPVIFSHAVRRQGGRVILWPHSANPVHVDVRREGTFDKVYAVTRAGCERWQAAFPEVEVVHAPTLMLDKPRREAPIDDSAPLSVVIIGGRSSLRHMPVLDCPRHEQTYREFFAGLEGLQADHAVKVFFKPRGLTGEHEMWLLQTVGLAAGWARVLQHPTRMDLPNMLFVSISMGSSALLEGLSRGIPGFIVRDFPVRDYTTIDDRVFPIGTTAEMLELVASCARPGGLTDLLDRQLARFGEEFDGH